MKANVEQEIRRLVMSTTAAAAIEEWKEASRNQRAPLYDYRGDHIEQVVQLAKYLATEAHADLEVVTLAAWFHDLAKPGLGGVSKEDHGTASAEIARGWLTEKKFNPALIARVCDAIKKHVGLTLKKPLEPIEAQVLWEADKIHKLGLIGMLQYILNGIRIKPGSGLKDYRDMLRDFLPLASKIAASAATEKGKVLAQARLKTLQELQRTLESELDFGSLEEDRK